MHCPDKGFIKPILFALSWGEYPIFNGYPGRERFQGHVDSQSVGDFADWLYQPHEQLDGKYTYCNIYHVFLWAIRALSIV